MNKKAELPRDLVSYRERKRERKLKERNKSKRERELVAGGRKSNKDYKGLSVKRYDEDGKKHGDVEKVECIFFFFPFRGLNLQFNYTNRHNGLYYFSFFAVKKVGNSVIVDAYLENLQRNGLPDIIIFPPFCAKLYHV